MKRKIFLLLSFIVYTSTYSQSVEDVFPKLNKRGMKSDILYSPAGISNISLLDKKTQNIFDYYQAYKALSFSDYKNRLNDLDLIKKLEKNETLSNNVLFGIIFTEFDMFEDNIDYEDVFRLTKSKKYKLKFNKKNVFKTNRLLVAAGLKQIQRGKKVTFKIKEEAFVNTTKLRFLKTEIDFDDGLGFREIKVGEVIEIKRGPLKMTIKMTAFLEKRVSATKAQECYEDLTPPDEYESAKREAKRLKPLPIGSSSKGRPSKKQRRDLEEFLFNEGLNCSIFVNQIFILS